MKEIRRLGYKGKLFCGVISSKLSNKYMNPLKELVYDVIYDEGAFIYFYNKKKNRLSLDEICKYFKMDIKEIEKKQRIFICEVEQILDDDILSIDTLLELYEKQIDEVKEKGFKKVILYTTIDDFCNKNITKKDLFIIHKRMKKICREKNIMILSKYIIDYFSEKDFLKFINLQDIFILEDFEGGSVYTYSELVKTSLVNLVIRQKKYEEYGSALHDFNNILTSIVGNSQTCLLKMPDDEIKRYLNTIYRAALDGQTMISKIRDCIKGDYKSKMGIQKGIYTLNGLVESSLKMLEYQVDFIGEGNRGHINFIKELNSTRRIYCNEFEIRRVILNILLNALDSIKGEGNIFIRTYDEGENTFIEIEDTGVGIEKDKLEKIFNPFFTTKGDRGTGLGLHIVKENLEHNCAKIKVESEVNKGSKFTILFPSYLEEDLYVIEEKESYEKEINILVVDDKYMVAKSIKEFISLLGMNADIEIKGNKVLERVSKKEYDLVICDYLMPDKNGIEVSQMIKIKYPNKPFILLTGWVDENLYKYDTIDYILQKPCTIEQLLQAIEKVLNTDDKDKNKNYILAK